MTIYLAKGNEGFCFTKTKQGCFAEMNQGPAEKYREMSWNIKIKTLKSKGYKVVSKEVYEACKMEEVIPTHTPIPQPSSLYVRDLEKWSGKTIPTVTVSGSTHRASLPDGYGMTYVYHGGQPEVSVSFLSVDYNCKAVENLVRYISDPKDLIGIIGHLRYCINHVERNKKIVNERTHSFNDKRYDLQRLENDLTPLYKLELKLSQRIDPERRYWYAEGITK